MSDRYENLHELSQSEIEGMDYRIVVRETASRILIMAIHGGRIELYTSQIAGQIAGEDFSSYRFEGIKERDNKRLHITSTRFDEPEARRLAARALVVVAIHGH